MGKASPSGKKSQTELEALEVRLKLARTELQGQRELNETISNSLKGAMYVADTDDFKIIQCNEAFLEKYGLEREAVIGRPCFEVTSGRDSPCDPTRGTCPHLETQDTGQPATLEHVFVTPDGETTYTEWSTLPVKNEAGRITRIVHIDRDVTNRRRTEEKLQKINQELGRSNAFLRNLIMSSVDALIAADMTGKILIFNKGAGQISGYSEDEALNEINIWDIYPGDGAKEVMRKLRSEDYGGKGILRSHQVEFLRKNGERVPISLSAAIVYDGEVEVGTAGFFYDLREKRRMERELDKTRIQLLQAEKMASVGKLAAGVAHQLNNPLGGITLFAQLLLEEYKLEPDAQEDVTRILDDAERCRVIVRELLQFARQTTKETRLSDINEALSRTLFLLENQSLFQQIEIITDLDPDLPRVPADTQRLNQAFMNIILNAADAMEGQGRITVKTSLNPTGDNVIVEIADTGPGIPDEVSPHLFEPFFTTKEEGKGTGLGLSVVYGIIEDHRGKIRARTKAEGGATFVIELKLKPPVEKRDSSE